MSSDPEAGRKLRLAIEEYAKKQIASSREVRTSLDAVLQCFVPGIEEERQLHSLVIDLVFRYVLAAASKAYQDAEDDGPQFDDALRVFLTKRTRLTEQHRDNFQRILKQAVLTSRAESPKSEVRNRLLRKQISNNCYLCGKGIDASDESLDHVWPQSAGGGTGKSNLFRIHAACGTLKGDLAVPGDAPMGRFAYGSNVPRQFSGTPEIPWGRTLANPQQVVTFLDDIRGATLRLAMIIRQDSKCAECKRDFRQASGTNVRKVEDELPWWFLNAQIVCDDCVAGDEHADL